MVIRGLADIISSGKHIQSDGVALIGAVEILFAVLSKEDGTAVDKDVSSFHPRSCDTETSLGHSDF